MPTAFYCALWAKQMGTAISNLKKAPMLHPLPRSFPLSMLNHGVSCDAPHCRYHCCCVTSVACDAVCAYGVPETRHCHHCQRRRMTTRMKRRMSLKMNPATGQAGCQWSVLHINNSVHAVCVRHLCFSTQICVIYGHTELGCLRWPQ